jgi:FKBP-type peptidyl-prolyl cis-trans isomerase
MKLLPEGSTAVLYIPSALAYGKFGTSGIPGNSNLIFEVELVDVIE